MTTLVPKEVGILRESERSGGNSASRNVEAKTGFKFAVQKKFMIGAHHLEIWLQTMHVKCDETSPAISGY
jgi:hypothetical protein